MLTGAQSFRRNINPKLLCILEEQTVNIEFRLYADVHFKSPFISRFRL
jgi:hypothetical protein